MGQIDFRPGSSTRGRFHEAPKMAASSGLTFCKMDKTNFNWDYKSAHDTMLTNENSQLVSDSKSLHVKLSPKYMGNIKTGVKNYLTAIMNNQEKMCDAFPIAYTNVKILQPFGKIISDQPCLHFDISADFIFFKPVIGRKLEGKINKVGMKHLGCLVHGCFNAWVPLTPEIDKTKADKIIGTEMEFTVVSITRNRNILSIKGKFDKFKKRSMIETDVEQSEKEESKSNDKNDITDHFKADVSKQSHTLEANVTGVEDSSVVDDTGVNVTESDDFENTSCSKKKKKHKKDKKKIEEENSNINASTISTQVKSLQVREKKSKKKKKHRTSVSDIDESGLSILEDSQASSRVNGLNDTVNTLDANISVQTDTEKSGKVKKHKKKSKHDKSVSDVDDSVNNTLDEPNISTMNGIKGLGSDSMSSQDIASDDKAIDTKKNRKRKHSDNFTKMKDRVADEVVLTEPPSAKKSKKNKKHSLDIHENEAYDSIDDFVISSSASKKSKKKKHRKESE
ncbi:hypothetical protein ACF0H5_015674 [Mactra antiquata]